MKTNEILKEILENNPELKKDEKKVKKIIDNLLENNPNIKANKEFKDNLKNRLENIIQMESLSTNRVFFFAGLVQVFSVFFVIAGFYYYFGGTTFFHSDKNIKHNFKVEPRIEKKVLDDELNEIDRMFNDELEKISIEKENNENNEDQIKPRILKTIVSPKEESKDISEIEPDSLNIELFTEENEEEDYEVEDNQIIDLLGEPEEDGEINNFKGISPTLMDGGIMESESSIMSDFMIDDDSEVLNTGTTSSGTLSGTGELLNFNDFCDNNMGQIINLEGENICIINQKRCMESDYKNGTCTFVEIK